MWLDHWEASFSLVLGWWSPLAHGQVSPFSMVDRPWNHIPKLFHRRQPFLLAWDQWQSHGRLHRGESKNKMETLVCLLKVGQGQVWSWETKLFFHIYFLLKRKSKVFVLTRLPSSHWSSTYMAQCSIITQRKMNEITWEIVKLLGWNLLRCIFFVFIIFRLFFNVWLILAPQ